MTDLEVARLAARKGRDTILEYRKKGIKVSQKGEHDLVTDADVAAEKAILSVLKEHFPNDRSEEHTSELQSRGHLVCRLLLEKKQIITIRHRLQVQRSELSNTGQP